MQIKKPAISESKSSYESFAEISGISCKVSLTNNLIKIKDSVTHMFVFRTIKIELLNDAACDAPEIACKS
jgi:hypothetical protein